MKIYEKEYLRRARIVSFYLQMVPFVRMIGLNGSLSRGEAKKSSDIDFLIIARKKRIWTCRMFATIITELSGYRRQGEKQAGMICLNRYQTDDFLDIQPHNKYHARVFSQLIPLTDIDGTYDKYLKENNWMKRLGWPLKENRGEIRISQILSLFRKLQERILDSSFGDGLEKVLKKYQKNRIMRDERTMTAPEGRIRVTDKELCFHPTKSS